MAHFTPFYCPSAKRVVEEVEKESLALFLSEKKKYHVKHATPGTTFASSIVFLCCLFHTEKKRGDTEFFRTLHFRRISRCVLKDLPWGKSKVTFLFFSATLFSLPPFSFCNFVSAFPSLGFLYSKFLSSGVALLAFISYGFCVARFLPGYVWSRQFWQILVVGPCHYSGSGL